MLFGFIILIVGLLLLLEAVVPGFYFDFDMIWPIILMFVSVIHMVKIKRVSLPIAILFFLGIWFLLWNMELIPTRYEDAFGPVVLILCGLAIISGTFRFRNRTRAVVKDGVLNYYGVFSSIDEKVGSNDFKGANVYAVFGGAELDFKNITIKEDVTIVVYSIFGGSEIILPREYNVVFESTAVLGGNDNKHISEAKKGAFTIYVNCISVFGGTEIR